MTVTRNFASAWPELIIACDVRGRGLLPTDGQTEGQTSQPGYTLCLSPLHARTQRSRSNITNFQPLLAFPMGYIPTKLHRFLAGNFRDFVRTDTAPPPKTTPARRMRTGNNRVGY